jgi:Fic family protein
MELPELYKEIDRLKAELDQLLPMKREDEERLRKKIRLEWNYHSNHIEGNTLTYGETEILLLLDKETGDHDPRDYQEMKAHDVAITLVYEHAADRERPITESFIKQLNKIILVNPFWKDAITPDGQKTKRLIDTGDYKKYSNSVRLSTGEMFYYASPEETPILMTELVEYCRSQQISPDVPIAELAASLHYRFVRIHPFDDGNGRTARLLMNYILLKNNLPPVIIKNKKDYLNALHRADSGDIAAFVKYIGKELLWSLHLSVKAAKGQIIADDDDINKEIAIFKRNLLSDTESIYHTSALTQKLKRFADESLLPFLEKLSSTLSQFNDLFYLHNYILHLPSAITQSSTAPDDFIRLIRKAVLEEPVKTLKFQFSFQGLKVMPHTRINADAYILLTVTSSSYTIRPLITGNSYELNKPLEQDITPEEITELSRRVSLAVMTNIQEVKEKLK